MRINKILPYIIVECESRDDAQRIQEELFNKGYKWIDGEFLDLELFDMYIFFPIFISNLPYKDKEIKDKAKNTRIEYNEVGNNILFFSEDKEDFNLSLLRLDKLDKLNGSRR